MISSTFGTTIAIKALSRLQSVLVYPIYNTLFMRDTKMLTKQGKLGTKGFKVIRGAAKTCRSTTCITSDN